MGKELGITSVNLISSCPHSIKKFGQTAMDMGIVVGRVLQITKHSSVIGDIVKKFLEELVSIQSTLLHNLSNRKMLVIHTLYYRALCVYQYPCNIWTICPLVADVLLTKYRNKIIETAKRKSCTWHMAGLLSFCILFMFVLAAKTDAWVLFHNYFIRWKVMIIKIQYLFYFIMKLILFEI